MLLCVHSRISYRRISSLLFFYNDTATTEIYTLSLHDALPISPPPSERPAPKMSAAAAAWAHAGIGRLHQRPGLSTVAEFAGGDRKSTRLNSSHGYISYAVFCLKKKKKQNTSTIISTIKPHSHR